MTISHEEALNLILANHCQQMGERDRDLYWDWYVDEFNIPEGVNPKDIALFTIDLHCAEAIVIAELVSTVGTIQYKIISISIK